MRADGVKAYRFPAGIFEMDQQLLVPEKTSIAGAASPNDMANPTASPDWSKQTLFLATRGVTDYLERYCHASDMVHTRGTTAFKLKTRPVNSACRQLLTNLPTPDMAVGFVLSSHTTVVNVSYQGIDTIRPEDNGALCGGGVFETKGCAENDCHVRPARTRIHIFAPTRSALPVCATALAMVKHVSLAADVGQQR